MWVIVCEVGWGECEGEESESGEGVRVEKPVEVSVHM